MDWWGPVVYEGYGGTEVGTATLATPQDWLEHPGCVGMPTPGTRMAFYDEEGNRLPGRRDRRDLFACQRIPTSLISTTKRSERAWSATALISLGDVGYMKEGRLYLCDRRSDMVIFGGTNIYPAEIEMVLTQCPGVKDCAVFGIPTTTSANRSLPLSNACPSRKSRRRRSGPIFSTSREVQGAQADRLHESLPREDSGKIFKRLARPVLAERRAQDLRAAQGHHPGWTGAIQ